MKVQRPRRKNPLEINPDKPLTDRQRQVLTFIRDSILRGASPTFEEILGHLGIVSPNGVSCHLNSLEARGLISLGGRGVARQIRLVGASIELRYHDTEAGKKLRAALGEVSEGLES